MMYLQNNLPMMLNSGEKLLLEDASGDQTLMIAKDYDLPFAVCGKADLALVRSWAKQHKEILAGLQRYPPAARGADRWPTD